MSTQTEQQPRRERSIIYAITVVVLVVLAVIAVVSFFSARETAEAQEKADELIQSLEDAGADVTLSAEQIAGVLGDDGGVVCADPNAALSRAALLDRLSNGAGGPGQRPILAEDRLVEAGVLIVQTYCPDELEEYQQFIDELNTVDADGDGS
jgi:Tfp pilus assembly protein FimT